MPQVVTCLLVKNKKLLILKRSEKVRTYKRFWGGVAGYIEECENPYETAVKEIQEETQILPGQIQLLIEGEPVAIVDVDEGTSYEWTIHHFVFKVKSGTKICLDWEHVAYQWIDPQDIESFKTVPHFKELIQQYLI
jgi:8-oxo-dGTP diphosphatase